VTVHPVAEGAILLVLPAGVALDAFGNPTLYTVSTAPSFYALNNPVVTMSRLVSKPTNSSLRVEITFSKAVTPTSGAVNAMIAVSTNVQTLFLSGGPIVFTIDLYFFTVADVYLRIPGPTFQDFAGLLGLTTYTYHYDITPPTVSVSLVRAGTDGYPRFLVNFSEPVTGFNDDTANSTLIAAMTDVYWIHISPVDSAGMAYFLDAVAVAPGAISLLFPAGLAEDGGGNKNLAAATTVTTQALARGFVGGPFPVPYVTQTESSTWWVAVLCVLAALLCVAVAILLYWYRHRNDEMDSKHKDQATATTTSTDMDINTTGEIEEGKREGYVQREQVNHWVPADGQHQPVRVFDPDLHLQPFSSEEGRPHTSEAVAPGSNEQVNGVRFHINYASNAQQDDRLRRLTELQAQQFRAAALAAERNGRETPEVIHEEDLEQRHEGSSLVHGSGRKPSHSASVASTPSSLSHTDPYSPASAHQRETRPLVGGAEAPKKPGSTFFWM